MIKRILIVILIVVISVVLPYFIGLKIPHNDNLGTLISAWLSGVAVIALVFGVGCVLRYLIIITYYYLKYGV